MKTFLLMLVKLCTIMGANAQSIAGSGQNLQVITELKDHVIEASNNAQCQMVNIKKLIPNLVLDLRYATQKNFTKTVLYPKALQYTFLRKEAAQKLLFIQKQLKKQGLALKVFDAYRPYSATKLMWDIVQDERYTANPSKGSGHNKGIAIDLTLVNIFTKKELDMGTGFDNFTDSAHHTFTQLSAQVLANRKQLKTVMEQFGFVALETEWWHYYLPNSKEYSLLNLSFASLLHIKY